MCQKRDYTFGGGEGERLVALRRVNRGELLVVARLDKLIVHKEAKGLRPLLAVRGRKLDLHVFEDR